MWHTVEGMLDIASGTTPMTPSFSSVTQRELAHDTLNPFLNSNITKDERLGVYCMLAIQTPHPNSISRRG